MNHSSSNNTMRAKVRTQHMPGSGNAGMTPRKGRMNSSNRWWLWVVLGLLLLGLIIFGITRLAHPRSIKHIDPETAQLPTKVVLVLGDGHAIGYAQQGDYPADAREKSDRKLALADGGWVNVSPFGERNGLDVMLVEVLEEAYPDDVIGVVKVALDGASIDMFLRQSSEDETLSLYSILRERFDEINAIPETEIIAAVWHHSVYTEQYGEKLDAVVEGIKRGTDNEDIPFLVGTQFSLEEYTAIVNELPVDLQAELEALNGGSDLLAAREAAAAASKNISLVNYEGLIVAENNPEGYIKIGERYAQEIIELLKK